MSHAHHPIAPLSRALLGVALGAIVSACHGGSNFVVGGGGGGGGGSTAVGSIVALDTEPRVDLPGVVSVFFRLFSTNGSPVANLDATHFSLFEDGQPVSQFESKMRLLPKPQVFRSFSHLVLDRSGSIVESTHGQEQEVAAAQAYVNLVAQTPESFVKVSWFDGQANLHPVIDFTNDRDALLVAIAHLHDEPPLNASTNLNGAIVAGCNALDAADVAAAAAGISFRTLTLVAFTDGRDTAGLVPFATALARVTQTVEGGPPKYNSYTIGLGSEIDHEALADLGPQGSVFAEDFDDLVPQFEAVARSVNDLANSFYYLSYCSPLQSSASTHVLTVRATNSGHSAERDYGFSAQHFGSGCGFLDVPFTTDLSSTSTSFRADSMIEDPQQRVVVVGSAFASNWDLVVWRLRVDGTLDTSFGDMGRATIPTHGAFVDVRGAAIANGPSGSYYVAGTLGDPVGAGSSQIAAWRFAENGTVIASFTTPALALGADVVDDLAVDGQGRIVLSGSSATPAFAKRTAVWRLTSALALDATFNGIGSYVHSNAADPLHQIDTGVACAVDALDRTIVVGVGTHPVLGVPDTKVIRVLATGSLDTTFGAGGLATNLVSFQINRAGAAADIELDSLGRLVIAGSLPAAGAQAAQPALWRLTSAGQPDTSFQSSLSSAYPNTGLVTLRSDLLDNALGHNFGLSTAINSLALHTDDTIVALGQRLNGQGDTDLAIFRFRANGVLHGDYNTVGFLVKDGTTSDNSSELGLTGLIHSDGRVWAAGLSGTGFSTDAAVWIDSEPEHRIGGAVPLR